MFCKKNGWTSGCIDAPQALQQDLLFDAVDKSIRRVAGSAFYAANRVGVVIVEGPFVLSSHPLIRLSTIAIWLELDERKSIERLLKRERNWFPLEHEDPQAYIDILLVPSDGKMKKRVEHHEYFSSVMRGNALAAIDVENKSRTYVADVAMGLIRGAFTAASHATNAVSPE